jgi:hypothetical protein
VWSVVDCLVGKKNICNEAVVWKDNCVVGVQVGEKGSDIAEVQFVSEIKEKLSVTKKAMVCRKNKIEYALERMIARV